MFLDVKGKSMPRLRIMEKMSYFFSSALEKKLSRELPTACIHSDGECPKMALSSKDQTLRMQWRKDAFSSTAICYPWPSVGWFVPPYHLPRCGCSSVPSPAFHGDPQLCEKHPRICWMKHGSLCFCCLWSTFLVWESTL